MGTTKGFSRRPAGLYPLGCRGIVRFWMDSLADLPSYKQGESIVRGIAFAKRRKCLPKGKALKSLHVPKPKVVTPKTNAMIRKASPDEIYKENFGT